VIFNAQASVKEARSGGQFFLEEATKSRGSRRRGLSSGTRPVEPKTFGDRCDFENDDDVTTALHEVFATVRQTAAAHASALDELERAFSAETVSNKSAEENCPHRHHFEEKEERVFDKM
jgi:hypothetical protein